MNILEALRNAAEIANISFQLLRAVCSVESDLNPNAYVARDGNSEAIGLCQLHVDTAKMVGFKGKREQLFNYKVNSLYAALYLRHLIDRYDGDWIKAISAYNAGTATSKNKKHVLKVLKRLEKYTNASK